MTNGKVSLFLSGDVMTGRGIDQILRHSVDPGLHEPWIDDAREYVYLAESVNGDIEQPVDDAYVWGDGLQVLESNAPDARIINLETAITANGKPWPRKGIHYRMHPGNIGLLKSAKIDCCVLANNHVLDWGYTGLEETLATLDSASIQHAGAGQELASAAAPAVIPVSRQVRVLVFGLGFPTSGIPQAWAAAGNRPGVNLVTNDSDSAIDALAGYIEGFRKPGDIVVASIHWGPNWGYDISRQRRRFAHALIDSGMVDVIHGHSSHHPQPIEIYRDKLILYGCGDLLNDYEGIREHRKYRGDLCLMYFPKLSSSNGKLLEMGLVPMQIEKFRLRVATKKDARSLKDTLDRESTRFDTRLEMISPGNFTLRWS